MPENANWAKDTRMTSLASQIRKLNWRVFFQSFGHHTVRQQIGGLRQFHDKYAEVITGDGEYDHEGIRQPLLKLIEVPEDTDGASRAVNHNA